MKRLLTIIYTMYVFQINLVPLNILGIAISNIGLFWYAIEKSKMGTVHSEQKPEFISCAKTKQLRHKVLVVLVFLSLVWTIAFSSSDQNTYSCTKDASISVDYLQDIKQLIGGEGLILIGIYNEFLLFVDGLDLELPIKPLNQINFLYAEALFSLFSSAELNIVHSCKVDDCDVDGLVDTMMSEAESARPTIVIIESRISYASAITQHLISTLPSRTKFVIVLLNHREKFGHAFKDVISDGRKSISFISASDSMLHRSSSQFRNLNMNIKFPLLALFNSQACESAATYEILIISTGESLLNPEVRSWIELNKSSLERCDKRCR